MEKKKPGFPSKIITCSQQSIESSDLRQTKTGPVLSLGGGSPGDRNRPRLTPDHPNMGILKKPNMAIPAIPGKGGCLYSGPILRNAIAICSRIFFRISQIPMLCWKHWKRWARDMGACCPHWHLSSACPAAGMCHVGTTAASQLQKMWTISEEVWVGLIISPCLSIFKGYDIPISHLEKSAGTALEKCCHGRGLWPWAWLQFQLDRCFEGNLAHKKHIVNVRKVS